MTLCYLGLGSNLGDRRAHLKAARAELARRGVRLLRAGTITETDPFGVVDQPRFLNQVLEVEWPGTPTELLQVTQAVEAAGGRSPSYRWGPREIDVDILIFDDLVVDTPELQVPHPGVAERPFVRAGLAELRPEILGP